MNEMSDAEFRLRVREAVHLPSGNDYEVLAEVEIGYHYYLLHRPAPRRSTSSQPVEEN
jgi:hypothetical protein